MMYKSTRNSKIRISASQAINQGISEEGGLFVPESLPDLSSEFEMMSKLDYNSLAKLILNEFLTDFSVEEIDKCVSNAYTSDKFGDIEPVKIKKAADSYFLELWHGPTCAFKDMALQLLPQLMSCSLKKIAADKTAVILVATSGDTGKAALEGFKDVDSTKIIVFYPENGVSPLQKMQMNTQEGKNVQVFAVKGNFDDTQTGVKKIFTDDKVKALLNNENMMFSSANSINWGRLLPQIVYYFYAYFDLLNKGAISQIGDKINVVVPSGNFGNILAAYYAKEMGLPINKFICASNANNVLTDFINTGIYDRKREFFTTSSPSMDILISSNLERLLYTLCGENSDKLANWMSELADKGEYCVDDETKDKLQEMFFGGCCDDIDTAKTINDMLNNEGYLCDTHTAVAVCVYEQYIAKTADKTPTLIVSTAVAYKFVHNVLEALGKDGSSDEFAEIDMLETVSDTCAPKQIKELSGKVRRFNDVIEKDDMLSAVLDYIGIEG